MRYFQTSNASRPYNTGGLTFVFEPVGQNGGNWLGVLAVEDDSAASTLAGAAAAQFPQIKEISETEYDDVKKKPQNKPSSFYESQRRQVVQPASKPAPVAPSVETDKPESLELPEPKTARIDPPDELARVDSVKAINKPARKP